MIDGLFERAAHIPLWVLSLGNAVVGIEELEAKMVRLGRTTRAVEIRYQHLPAVATDEKKATNREFLVVGWNRDGIERILEGKLRAATPCLENNDVGSLVVAPTEGGLPHLTIPVVREDSNRVRTQTKSEFQLSQDPELKGHAGPIPQVCIQSRRGTWEDDAGANNPALVFIEPRLTDDGVLTIERGVHTDRESLQRKSGVNGDPEASSATGGMRENAARLGSAARRSRRVRD